MNYPIEIPAVVYDILQTLLTRGIINYEGKIIDFSPVQVIRIQDGLFTFNPPARFEVMVGPLKIKTTISQMQTKGTSIKIEVDHSIVDMELIPK